MDSTRAGGTSSANNSCLHNTRSIPFVSSCSAATPSHLCISCALHALSSATRFQLHWSALPARRRPALAALPDCAACVLGPTHLQMNRTIPLFNPIVFFHFYTPLGPLLYCPNVRPCFTLQHSSNPSAESLAPALLVPSPLSHSFPVCCAPGLCNLRSCAREGVT